jgi:hypothetical protein
MIKFPHIEVQLTGNDGNAFQIIGAVGKALRMAGLPAAEKEFRDAAFQSESYDTLLRLATNTVTVL